MTEFRLSAEQPIFLASKNRHKVSEIRQVWGSEPPPLADPPADFADIDEQFDTYEDNAILKARSLAEALGAPALADDSGIEVSGLGWGPGVRSARTPYPRSTPVERNENVLAELRGLLGDDRRARFVCVCALVVPGFDPIVARGEVEGFIADEPRGTGGFGYDPIFFYPPFGITFAQAGQEKKNSVSHRGNAVRALRQKLRDLIE